MRVKEILKEKGITSKELADKLGMTETGFSIAIGKKGNPPLKRLQEIADALNLPISDLFERPSDEIVGVVRIGENTHVINSLEDIKKLTKSL